ERGGGKEGRPNPRAAGAFLRAVFLRGTEREVVRADRERAQRADARAHAEAREEAQDGARRADLRSGNDRTFLQHRSGVRCRRKLSREIPQASYPALPSGILGEVLFHAGERWVS